MSEAHESQTDSFEAEFEAARQAEAGDDDADAAPAGDDGDEGGEEADPETAQAAEAEKVTKRLRDTQRALKQERLKRQDDQRKFDARLEALEKGRGAKDAPLDPAALLAKLREDDDDPIGDIQTVKQLAKLLVGQTQEESQADQAATQRASALQTVSEAMRDYEGDFKEIHPDYEKAAKHFMDARAEELADTGLTGDALRAAMQNDFAGIVTRSIAAGKDPAEIIYNMASRRGYKAGAAAAKLDTIERGQAQSKTLTGGGAPSGNLSMGKVADLKGAAFDAAFDKLRAAERRRG